jgi:hypothetical protein
MHLSHGDKRAVVDYINWWFTPHADEAGVHCFARPYLKCGDASRCDACTPALRVLRAGRWAAGKQPM